MPGMDGTGPMGRGNRGGRAGLGAQARRGAGFGGGRQGGVGGGRGLGPCGWGLDSEQGALQTQVEELRNTLKNVESRLAELSPDKT